VLIQWKLTPADGLLSLVRSEGDIRPTKSQDGQHQAIAEQAPNSPCISAISPTDMTAATRCFPTTAAPLPETQDFYSKPAGQICSGSIARGPPPLHETLPPFNSSSILAALEPPLLPQISQSIQGPPSRLCIMNHPRTQPVNLMSQTMVGKLLSH
jgi:hypothetical protein